MKQDTPRGAQSKPLQAAAQEYHDRGWVSIRLKGKAPIGDGWQNRKLTDPIPQFKDGDNIGVLLGSPSGGLARIDPDFRPVAAITAMLFPEPTATFGRVGSPASGRLYICAGIKSTDFRLPPAVKNDPRLPIHGGKPSVTVLQVLASGKQTVAPPSIHPNSREEITWIDVNTKPQELNRAELLRRAGIEAFCMAVRQFWPPKGTRNEAAMALARTLLETFATSIADDEERIVVVDEMVLAIAMAGGDGEESRQGKERAAATLAKMRAGEATTGLTTLVELLDLPEAVIKVFRKWLGLAVQVSVAVNSGLRWREWRANGNPLPTMHNAIIAIGALGIECRHDAFHHKTFIGHRDSEVHHEIKTLVGEVTDAGLVLLRKLLSDRYGFDFGAIHVYDAVMTIAFENRYDPVLDMLDKAQADWDKTERLDAWVVTYLGCEDTKLNRAIGRKTLIAAVRRARVPGCKFDRITILEGAEGRNKSSAIRILAGDENFSDQSILGASDKEIQEQLAGVWMHENADLAGMKRADVEQVKAFASRQVDRARPAYGRTVESRPRRSIEWGTTNDSEYLQSQTGNRRFWPLKTGTIDIEQLAKDRLQILGEAAHHEANGESLLFDDESLWDAVTEEQEERRVKDPWESILADIPPVVVIAAEEERDGKVIPARTVQIVYLEDGRVTIEKVSSQDLLTYVLRISAGQQNSAHERRLSIVMQKAGWTRGRFTIRGLGKVRGFFREEVL